MTIPESMNALIVKGHGCRGDPRGRGTDIETFEPYLEYGSLPFPKPGPGEVLIKVRMASVNPSDLYFIKGEYGQPRIKGAAAGFEGVGDVVAGKGLYAAYLKGKRVAFVGGVAGSGAWAEYIVVQAAMCVVDQAGNARRRCGRPRRQSGDCVDHVRHRQEIWLEELRLSPPPSQQLGKLMAGLARDNGFRDDRCHPKGESGCAPQGARRGARIDPV
jgi:hypothetical protein